MKRLRKIVGEGGALVAAVILGVLALNILAANHFGRLDLTAKKNYTLAPATRALLESLEDRLTVRLYFSKELPPLLEGLRKNVGDILDEFRAHSGAKVRVEWHDPQENAVVEQKVQMLGIPPVEVNVLKKDKQEVARIYLGMTIHYLSKQETLPVVQDIRNLEYRIASAILQITRPKEPVIGVWEPSGSEAGRYELLMKVLQQRFRLNRIGMETLDRLDPEETPALLFFVPETLEKEAEKAFRGYLDKGGKALLFLNRITVGAEGGGLVPAEHSNPLEEILKEYGIETPAELVADPSNVMATFTGGIFDYQVPYPFWIRVRPEGFNRQSPIVSEMASLVLPWPAALKETESLPEGIERLRLAQSSPEAVKTAAGSEPLDVQKAQGVLERGPRETVPLILMARREKKEQTPGAELVVIPNTLFLANDFLQRFEENLVFVENTLDIFSAGEALIGIRSKGAPSAPLPPLGDAARRWIKIADMLVGPFLLLILAAVVYSLRRKRARFLQKEYGHV